MQMIAAAETAQIKFRGEMFIVSATDLIMIQMMRQQRIEREEYFIPDGSTVQDFFATNGIPLEDGGEICPNEMGVHVGPSSPTSRMLASKFGNKWFTYDGWNGEMSDAA